jgi:parallel beta-helix repeat protein
MRRLVVLALGFLFIAMLFSPATPIVLDDDTGVIVEDTSIEFHAAQSYTPMAPMNITSNADFVSEGWNGSGTLADPYEIANVEITSINNALRIVNTTAHFAVRYCSIKGTTHQSGWGIQLDNVTNGEISNCEFTAIDDAFGISDSSNSSFSDNTVWNCSLGIGAWASSHLEILRNTIRNGSSGGYFMRVTDSVIAENTVSDMFFRGFSFGDIGNGSVVSDNTFYDISIDMLFDPAIDISFSEFWRIEHNTIYNCFRGIYSMWDSSYCIVSSNNLTDNAVGIEFSLCHDMEISHNIITGGHRGISVYQSDAIEIDDNTVDSTTYSGISISGSMNCVVTSNHINSNGLSIEGYTPSQYLHTVTDNLNADGRRIGYFNGRVNETINGAVYFQIYLVNCTGVTVENGIVGGGGTGIVVAFSDRCTFQQSTVISNARNGIELLYATNCDITDCGIINNGNYWGSYGIKLVFTNNTRITRNLIFGNNGTGIAFTMGSSSYCFIYNNLITNNTGIGIDIMDGCMHNTIYGNAIGWNEDGNAEDRSSDSKWDDGESLGNWWSDYNGTGVYEIEGSANSVDNYPNQYTSWTARLPLDGADITGLGIILMSAAAVGVVIVIVLFILRRRNAV